MLKSRFKIILSLWLLIIFSSMSSIAANAVEPNPQDTTCLALFAYMPNDGNTIELFNLSLGGYQEARWDMGDGVTYTNPEFPLTHSYDSPGYYNVCLTIQDSLSCFSDFCLPVLTLPEDSICEQAECVLPGDTNKDGDINIFDALAIGLGFNFEGFPRPDATIESILQVAFDWLDSLIEGLDAKHADCDGNGIINEADFIAIDQNYQRVEKNDSLLIDSEQPVVTLSFASDTITLENAGGNALTIPATLSIGSEEQPVEDFYGIALSFDYDNDQVQEINTQLLANAALPSKTVFQEDKVFKEEQYGLVISNTQQIGKNIHGPVAEVGFVIIEDLISAKTIHIDINDVKVINSKGKELPVSIENDSISLTILSIENRSITTNTQEVLDANISISPNPTTDLLQVKVAGAITNQTGQVVLYNSLGKLVMERQEILNNTTLNLANLPKGIYWLELLFEEGRVSRKVVKGY